MKSGQKFGPWELRDFLARGGNGEVWKAFRPDYGLVALKVLNSGKPDSEPYKRFQAEVQILKEIGPRKGVIRLLDSAFPQKPGDPRPWLAMEIAIPIKEALGKEASVEDVIRAIADISETLALLAREGIHHRDIKPDNLFRVAAGWAIGDFGLASYPNKDALTEDGRKLGPIYYIAPEMLNNPTASTGGPADVYSLAKTLWVLVTGQRYPLSGPYQSEIEQVALQSYVNHPRIAALDNVLEKATLYDPLARPTMAQFAEEMRAWLIKPSNPTPPQDVSNAIARIRPVLIRKRNREIGRQRQLETFDVMVKEVCSHLRPFQVICRRDLMGVEQTRDEVNSPIQTIASEWLDQVVPIPNENDRPIRHEQPRIEAFCRPSGKLSGNLHGQSDIAYYGLVDMRLYEGGDALLRSAHIVETRLYATPQQANSKYDVVWEASQRVQILSAVAEVAIHNLLEMWTNEFRRAIELFVGAVENTKS